LSLGKKLNKNMVTKMIELKSRENTTLLMIGTYFNPLSLVNISSMGTFIKQRSLMVIMLV